MSKVERVMTGFMPLKLTEMHKLDLRFQSGFTAIKTCEIGGLTNTETALAAWNKRRQIGSRKASHSG